jgi:gas vesicle protein
MSGSFLKGIGVGIVAGTAIAMMISPPDKKKMMHSGAGRVVKALGDIVEGIADAMS